MKGNVTVTIVIATYNAQKYLLGCLQSVAGLSLNNAEVLVIDGGSTDNTLSIVEQFESEYEWIRHISEKDKGIYDALNKGAAMAKGKWIHFLGSDDRLLPGFKSMMNKLTVTDTVYYGNSEEYYEGEKPQHVLYRGKFSNYRLAKYCINHQSVFYPADVFKYYQYELQYRVFADYALNIRVWGDDRFSKKHEPFTVVRYHMSGFSATNQDPVFKKDKPRLIRQHLGVFVYLRYLLKKFRKKVYGEPDW